MDFTIFKHFLEFSENIKSLTMGPTCQDFINFKNY